MIVKVFAVKDLAISAFLQPMFSSHQGQVMRSFVDEVNRQADDSPMFKHPDDYELYFIGEFDGNSGVLTSMPVELLCRGKDVKIRSSLN